jgi:predicted DNA-binding transcriptional regulator AlpA
MPKHISLGGRAKGWLENEINTWLEEQINASRNLQNDGGVNV